MQLGLDTMSGHSNSVNPLLLQEPVESEYYYCEGIRILMILTAPKNCEIPMTLFYSMKDQFL